MSPAGSRNQPRSGTPSGSRVARQLESPWPACRPFSPVAARPRGGSIPAHCQGRGHEGENIDERTPRTYRAWAPATAALDPVCCGEVPAPRVRDVGYGPFDASLRAIRYVSMAPWPTCVTGLNCFSSSPPPFCCAVVSLTCLAGCGRRYGDLQSHSVDGGDR